MVLILDVWYKREISDRLTGVVCQQTSMCYVQYINVKEERKCNIYMTAIENNLHIAAGSYTD